MLAVEAVAHTPRIRLLSEVEPMPAPQYRPEVTTATRIQRARSMGASTRAAIVAVTGLHPLVVRNFLHNEG